MSRRIDCPRCLGKGEVNKEDIKRLKREFFWSEGHCAFCDGQKTVQLDFAKRFNADDWYISFDMDKEEYEKYISGDKEMLSWVRHTEKQIYFIGSFIMDHHISRGLSKEKVLDLLSKELQVPNSEIKESLDEMINLIKDNIINE